MVTSRNKVSNHNENVFVYSLCYECMLYMLISELYMFLNTNSTLRITQNMQVPRRIRNRCLFQSVLLDADVSCFQTHCIFFFFFFFKSEAAVTVHPIATSCSNRSHKNELLN